jgi:hypothetical protein
MQISNLFGTNAQPPPFWLLKGSHMIFNIISGQSIKRCRPEIAGHAMEAVPSVFKRKTTLINQ